MRLEADNQKRADRFDLDLFNLIEEAAQQAENWRPVNKKIAAKWQGIASNLRQARPDVRMMMSEADRKATQ